jgi:hypothetical protein
MPPPIWSSLQVEPGWETALEAVLRERLGALAGVEAAAAERVLADPPPATLAMVFAGEAAAAETAGLDADTALRDKVRCSDPRWEPASTNGWPASMWPTIWARSLPAAPACRRPPVGEPGRPSSSRATVS